MNMQELNKHFQEEFQKRKFRGLLDNSYFTLDSQQDIRYPEQHLAVSEEASDIFIVSMAILDPSIIFDPNKNFRSNVECICAKDHKRALRYEGKNDFIRAYSAGARTMIDEVKSKGIEPSYLLFETMISFEQNKKDAHMFLLSTGERPISLRGSYSFNNFNHENEYILKDDFHQDRLSATYNLFKNAVEQIEENEIFKSVLINTIAHERRRSGTFPNFGNFLTSIVNNIIMCAAGTGNNLYAFVPFLIKVQELEDDKLVNLKYMTRTQYLNQTNDDICLLQLTAPLRDPAAAYNLLQFKKFNAVDRCVEGEKQAEKAAAFLNEQKENFRLPHPKNKPRPN